MFGLYQQQNLWAASSVSEGGQLPSVEKRTMQEAQPEFREQQQQQQQHSQQRSSQGVSPPKPIAPQQQQPQLQQAHQPRSSAQLPARPLYRHQVPLHQQQNPQHGFTGVVCACCSSRSCCAFHCKPSTAQ